MMLFRLSLKKHNLADFFTQMWFICAILWLLSVSSRVYLLSFISTENYWTYFQNEFEKLKKWVRNGITTRWSCHAQSQHSVTCVTRLHLVYCYNAQIVNWYVTKHVNRKSFFIVNLIWSVHYSQVDKRYQWFSIKHS